MYYGINFFISSGSKADFWNRRLGRFAILLVGSDPIVLYVSVERRASTFDTYYLLYRSFENTLIRFMDSKVWIILAAHKGFEFQLRSSLGGLEFFKTIAVI